MKKRIVLLLCAYWVSAPVWADDKTIVGAFGINFEDVIKVEDLKKIRTEKNGGMRYRFEPSQPYAPLTEYSVSVTPLTKRAYQVTAIGKYGSMKDCKVELIRLEKVLSKKYKLTTNKINGRFGDVPRIAYAESDRFITAACEGVFNRRELIVIYADKLLTKEAGREDDQLLRQRESEMAMEREDTSGL